MYVGRLPVLNSSGNWAVYFGGPDILAGLTGDLLLRWNIVNSVISCVFQIILLVIKTLKARHLTSHQANMYVMAGNFMNVNGILTSVIMVAFYVFIYFLVTGDYLNLSPDQSSLPPFSVLMASAILLTIQLRPFFCNRPLR